MGDKEEESIEEKVETIGEIIEATFSDKKVADSFGVEIGNEEKERETEEIVEMASSPNKRKMEALKVESKPALDLSAGETTDVKDNVKDGVDCKELPSKRLRVNDLELPKTVKMLLLLFSRPSLTWWW